MRDAEAARLEILNEALDPVFAEIPQGVEIFDRGVSRGEVPRLWIDIVAYVLMGRDKRTYRFVQDTRYGRKVVYESADIPEHDESNHTLCRRPSGRARARACQRNACCAR